MPSGTVGPEKEDSPRRRFASNQLKTQVLNVKKLKMFWENGTFDFELWHLDVLETDLGNVFWRCWCVLYYALLFNVFMRRRVVFCIYEHI